MTPEIKQFEGAIKDFYGARYAVAVDCCTHAIELCLRLYNPKNVTCPTHTYLSIPMTMHKLNIPYSWDLNEWVDYYQIGNTNIIDAAVYWKERSYIGGTMMCLSFQYKKHLNLGRGGMILLDNEKDYNDLCKMRYDGRSDDLPWKEQDVEMIGYHYYMTPESAKLGLEKFDEVKNKTPKQWSYLDYPDLSKMKVFYGK